MLGKLQQAHNQLLQPEHPMSSRSLVQQLYWRLFGRKSQHEMHFSTQQEAPAAEEQDQDVESESDDSSEDEILKNMKKKMEHAEKKRHEFQ